MGPGRRPELLDSIIAHVMRLGADEAEVFLVRTWMNQVRIFNQQLEVVRSSEIEGIAVRANFHDRQGHAYVSPVGTSPQSLAEAVMSAARHTMPDPARKLPCVRESCHPSRTERRARGTDLSQKADFAQRAEAAALAHSPLVIGTEDVEYVDYDQETCLVNSHGALLYQDLSFSVLGVTVVSDEGGTLQSGTSYGYSPVPGDFNPEQVGIEAAERALRIRAARPRPSAEVPVVFDPFTASGLIRIVAGSFDADAVARGRSRLKGRIGEAVASSHVTLVDQGNLEGAPAFSAFDGEGVITGRSVLVQDGMLLDFLRTAYAGYRDGLPPTGNARRRSFRSLPEFGPANFFLEPGKDCPEHLYSSLTEGLYVQELQGLHLANRVSGDFSVGVTGQWIRNGQLAEPVRGITVAANAFDLLRKIDRLGNDLRFVPQLGPNRASFGSPSIRVRSMVVSGKD